MTKLKEEITKLNYKSEIVKIIKDISGKYSPYQIFRDWCECYAIAISNACTLHHHAVWKEREEKYKGIISKYDEKEVDALRNMTALYPMALEDKITDLLGEIYMESGAGNSATGQFFTPFHVSEMMARLQEHTIKEEYEKTGMIHLHEPSVGSGGMIIATAKVCKEMGINYQRKMKVVCQDLDWLAVYMTYIQISLLGINGIVAQGDTLKEPYNQARDFDERRILRTPANTGALI